MGIPVIRNALNVWSFADDLDSGVTALIVISSMAVGGFLLSLVGYSVYKHIQ